MMDAHSQFLLRWGIIGKMEEKKAELEMDVLSFTAFFDQSLRAILSPWDHFNLIWREENWAQMYVRRR